ncbi:MAG TPA: Fe-S cluster assembly protein SufD, partial [Candidatus Krumholzibacteria bacterium]|nr:Fe-S cluster assembly protein SufD [Candidatus Krumholzibacteria bacterium]
MPGVAAYESAFAKLEPALKASGPAWLHDLRREGLERFKSLGFPSLKEEEWRFTRTRPIAELDFVPAAAAPALADAVITSRTFDDSSCRRLVLVNGALAPKLAQGPEWPKGVRAESLAEAMRRDGERIRELLARGARAENQRFAALNTAFLNDGVL